MRRRSLSRPRAAFVAALVLSAGIVAPALGQESAAQESIDRRYAIASDAYVKIYSLDGAIIVRGWDRDSLVVTGTVSGGDFEMGAGDANAKMFVEADDENAPATAELEVLVPSGATVWVKSQTAVVEVSDIAGGIDVYSVTGRIRIEGDPRQVYAESMGGDVELAVVSSSVRGKTAGGSITLRGESRDVSLSTVAGDISIVASPMDRGRFETVTGNIWFEGAVERGGSLGFQSHSGTVELRLPRGISADFTLTTVEGKVVNDYGGTPMGRAGSRRGNSVRFEVGEGDADVIVETFSGMIAVRADVR